MVRVNRYGVLRHKSIQIAGSAGSGERNPHRYRADEAQLPDLPDDGVRLPGADGDLLVAALRVVAVEEAAVRVHHPLTEAPA